MMEIVNFVVRSHNPKMQMNENKATYVQYFKTKYNIDIQASGV